MDRKQIYLSTIDPEAGAVAREYGLGVEIADFCTAWNMDDKLAETKRKLERTLSGISRRTFHGPFNELFPCAIDPKARELARERFRQAIVFAQNYGAEKLVLHGGFNPWIYYPQWYVEQSILFWRAFIQEVPDSVTICLENVMEQTPEMLLEIIRTVDDPKFQLCLDIGHCNVYSKVPVQDWLSACVPYLAHLHIHNNCGSEDTHSPLNAGTIPIREVLQYVQQRCPDITATLELPQSKPSVQWLLEE